MAALIAPLISQVHPGATVSGGACQTERILSTTTNVSVDEGRDPSVSATERLHGVDEGRDQSVLATEKLYCVDRELLYDNDSSVTEASSTT